MAVCIEPKYSVGDVISWFCDDDGETHSGVVQYINKAVAATGVEINYEVHGELFGEPCVFFVDELDAYCIA